MTAQAPDRRTVLPAGRALPAPHTRPQLASAATSLRQGGLPRRVPGFPHQSSSKEIPMQIHPSLTLVRVVGEISQTGLAASYSNAARCFSTNSATVIGRRPPIFWIRSLVPAKTPLL